MDNFAHVYSTAWMKQISSFNVHDQNSVKLVDAFPAVRTPVGILMPMMEP